MSNHSNCYGVSFTAIVAIMGTFDANHEPQEITFPDPYKGFYVPETREFNPLRAVQIGADIIAQNFFDTEIFIEPDGPYSDETYHYAEELIPRVNYKFSVTWDGDTHHFIVQAFNVELFGDVSESREIDGSFLRAIKMKDVLSQSLSPFSGNFETGYKFFVFDKYENGKFYATPFRPLPPAKYVEHSKEGPSPTVLRYVARLYVTTGAARMSPHKIIAELFAIPSRTASHWIKLARERGYFDYVPFREMKAQE